MQLELCASFISNSNSFKFPPAAVSSTSMSPNKLKLPDQIIVGYANWNQCDEKIVQAVKDGVNVVIWFATNLAVSPDTNLPLITGGPDWDCVADVIKTIRDLEFPTVHLISIGGWNSPHPDTSVSAEDMYNCWNDWNRHTVARPDKGFFGFDGFDWDIEGRKSCHLTVCFLFLVRFYL